MWNCCAAWLLVLGGTSDPRPAVAVDFELQIPIWLDRFESIDPPPAGSTKTPLAAFSRRAADRIAAELRDAIHLFRFGEPSPSYRILVKLKRGPPTQGALRPSVFEIGLAGQAPWRTWKPVTWEFRAYDRQDESPGDDDHFVEEIGVVWHALLEGQKDVFVDDILSACSISDRVFSFAAQEHRYFAVPLDPLLLELGHPSRVEIVERNPGIPGHIPHTTVTFYEEAPSQFGVPEPFQPCFMAMDESTAAFEQGVVSVDGVFMRRYERLRNLVSELGRRP